MKILISSYLATSLLLIGTSLVFAETLTWTAQPTVASYKVYHRLSTESDYGLGVITGASATYPTGVLSPGTHVFAVTALDATGKESVKSAEVFKEVLAPDPSIAALGSRVTKIEATLTALCKALGGC